MENGNSSSGAHPRRRKALLGLSLVFTLAGVGYGSWWLASGRYHEATDDAYVSGNLIQVTPRISGTVVTIDADNTDRVKAGQVLVQLDDADARIKLQTAEAALAQTIREVRQSFEAVKQHEASVVVKQAVLAKVQQDLKRRLGLLANHSVSAEDVAHARTLVDTAQAELHLEQSLLAAARVQVAGLTVETHPAVRQAEARLRDAWLALSRCTIRAPVAGLIAKRQVQLGEQVSPGEPLMALVGLDQLWVEANIKEDQLAHVHIGQPVTLRADSYGDDVIFHGRVFGLSPGTGSAFALLPPQNASGNWIKIVQRLPVRISLDAGELAAHPLRLGLSMKVDIDTHDRSDKPVAQPAVDPPRYATTVYANEVSGVEAVIQQIIDRNDAPAATFSGQ